MSTRKSLFFSFVDRYASLVISVASSMVIARLLTPAEIGIFSVTMVLLTFVATVRDMGAGMYLVQEKDLTIDRIRAVWAVQLSLGIGLALVVLLASYPAAAFYREPRMRDIMFVIAFNYAINPFGSLTYAWLMREMRFGSVALIRFSAALSGALATVWMAWQQYGPISLAFGSLASTMVNALMGAYFRPKFFPWLPSVREIRRVLAFGSRLTASSIINTLSTGAPDLLLGKLQGLAEVGLFSRAMGLVMMFYRLFVDAVSTVCLPWFARQRRENGSLVDPFVKATSYVTALGWSFCVAIVCLAHPIVRVMYGHQWDQSVDVARVLAVFIAVGAPAALCGTALLSSGAVSLIARVTLVVALQGLVLVAFGAWQGMMALGLALVASASVGTAIWLRVTCRSIGLPWRALAPALGKSAAVAAFASVGPLLAVGLYGPYPDAVVMPLLVGGGGGLMGFLGGVWLLQHPLADEITQMWSQVSR